MRRTQQTNVLVAGVGNLLMRDDGVGVHAIHELQKDPLPDTDVLDVGTAIFSALPFFESAQHVLLIDAARAGGPPGSIYVFHGRDAGAHAGPASLHSVGPIETLRWFGGVATPKVTVLGVEPEVVDYGTELSTAVRAALPEVVETARRIVSLWRRGGFAETPLGALA
jgi:hydrogenase maturation protease